MDAREDCEDPEAMKQTPAGFEIEEDHRAVRDVANGILGAISKPAGSGADLCDRAVALLEKSRTHFALEEGHWNRDQGWKDDPTTARWVEGLVREHRGFEERLKDVIETLRSERERPTFSAETVARIRTLLEELFAHELSETKLFQRRVFEES